MAYFGTSSGAVLCHGCCHTGTELSCDTLKLSECVQKKFCEVLKALDWAKQTAGSQDMHFLSQNSTNTVPAKERVKQLADGTSPATLLVFLPHLILFHS